MAVIDINHLTHDYGQNRGVFDISLSINQGEVYGYLGPNGAGKSTTMRHLLGFIKAQKGSVAINDLNCWTKAKEIQKQVGYLAGEITFPDDMTGKGYLNLIAKMRHMHDMQYAEELMQYFEITSDMLLKHMSKGMRQKIGITAALMHNPSVILLDEPTSGLDPLMQNKFVELIKKEKQKGKTILMSSHMLSEVEQTCDKIGIIKNGHLIKEITIEQLHASLSNKFIIEFEDNTGINDFIKIFTNAQFNSLQASLTINANQINQFISCLSQCNIKSLKQQDESLEEYFMQFYGGSVDD